MLFEKENDMEYTSYERDERTLVFVTERPQWLVLDRQSFAVFALLADGHTPEAVMACCGNTAEVAEMITGLVEAIFSENRGEDDRSPDSLELDLGTAAAVICITKRCNMSCPHCYISAGGKESEELSTNEHRKIAVSVGHYLREKNLQSQTINLTGGEPFVRKDVLEIIQFYRDEGLRVVVSSNGISISKKHIDSLTQNGTELCISLDGATPETHDMIRGKGAFRKATDTIRMLSAAGIKVGVNTVMHQGNLHELSSILDLTHELGAISINPIGIMKIGRAVDSGLKTTSDVTVFRTLAKAIEEKPERLKLLSHTSLFSSLGAAVLYSMKCESCGIGDNPYVFISETGDVFPCPNARQKIFKLGNVLTHSLAECVQTVNPWQNKLRGINVSVINTRCAKCDVRYFCGGDCRGETFMVTGNIEAPYPNCQDRHDSIVELAWIIAEHPEYFEERANDFGFVARGT